MRNTNYYIQFIFCISLFVCSTSCKREKKSTAETYSKKDSLKDITLIHSEQFYYYSKTSNPKYNHKINGKDENGNEVKGVVNLEGDIAIGVLKKDDEKEIEIISESINSNRIIATDINGFQYRLKLDE